MAVNEPDYIKVQHILVGFTGSIPGKNVQRTQEEAKKLAEEILERAQKGENFDELVKKYTDDQAPGIYEMTNVNSAAKPGAFRRLDMVPAFGDVGFKLEKGSVGLANFDPNSSPYGFHVIKRVE